MPHSNVRRALSALGIELRIVDSASDVPSTTRWFDDVAYHDGLLVQLRGNSDDIVDSLWHEVGHAVSSDERSFAGYNWCWPMPRHLPVDDRENGLENEACAGTLLAMIAARRPLSEIRHALQYVNTWEREYAQRSRVLATRPRVKALLGRIRDSVA